jgi:hypothetical protein
MCLASATGRMDPAQIKENAMAMSNLSTCIGAQALLGTNISHRRARGPRVLRIESAARPALDRQRVRSRSGSAVRLARRYRPDASTASMRQEESRMWMTVGERRFAITLTDNAAAVCSQRNCR